MGRHKQNVVANMDAVTPLHNVGGWLAPFKLLPLRPTKLKKKMATCPFTEEAYHPLDYRKVPLSRR